MIAQKEPADILIRIEKFVSDFSVWKISFFPVFPQSPFADSQQSHYGFVVVDFQGYFCKSCQSIYQFVILLVVYGKYTQKSRAMQMNLFNLYCRDATVYMSAGQISKK